jgi:glutathione S-transferase
MQRLRRSERLAAEVYRARVRRGPACGRRWLVNSQFNAANIFFGTLFANYSQTWVGAPKGHRRYKALKRSRMAHGHSTEDIGLLEKVTREWRNKGG